MSDGQMSYNHEVLQGISRSSTMWVGGGWAGGVDSHVPIYFVPFSVMQIWRFTCMRLMDLWLILCTLTPQNGHTA